MKIDLTLLNNDTLLRHGIVNRAGLAKLMYVGNNYADTKLDAKLRGNNGRRITPKDRLLLESVLQDFLVEIGVVVENE